jgi:hypothetical protein
LDRPRSGFEKPGAGGANHRYEISDFDTKGNPSEGGPDGYTTSYSKLVLLFPNGPIAEAGVNGVTQEVLLAIIADRLRSFQAGPYARKENACALTKIEEGELHFLARTNPSREWIFLPAILPHMIDKLPESAESQK